MGIVVNLRPGASCGFVGYKPRGLASSGYAGSGARCGFAVS